jgi:hypothetical protein
VTFFNPACGAREVGYFGGRTSAGRSNETGYLRCPTGDRLRDCEWDDPVGTMTRPPARSFAAASRGSIASVVLLFGGRGTAPLNDVWTLDPCAGGDVGWVEMAPSGTAPAGRWAHTMTLQPGSSGAGDLERYVVFGGFATMEERGPAHADVHRLTRLGSSVYEWEPIEVASGPDDPVIPSRGRHVAVMDEEDGELRLWVYGGIHEGQLMSDFWELRIVP